MRHRFQTRLTLSISLLVGGTVLLMTLLAIFLAAGFNMASYARQGFMLTQLAIRNIEYGKSLPDKAMAAVGDQMVVSALLTSELVALAENRAGMEPDEISDLLRRVIDRSEAVRGEPLVDEFWVTDDTGRAYIRTSNFDFTFSPDPVAMPQASAFWPLLTGTPVVVQDLLPREADGRLFKYVGVAGADKPRIVQVGVSGERASAIRAGFDVQNVVERFVLDGDVQRMAVIDVAGQVTAAANNPRHPDVAPVDDRVIAFCMAYLEDRAAGQREPFRMMEHDGQLGVVTPLTDDGGNPTGALYIEHRTAEGQQSVRRGVLYMAILGLVLLALSLAVSRWLSGRVSKPLHLLAEGVRRFGEGDLAHRVRIDKPEEFRNLAHTFNTMAGDMQQSMRDLEAESQRRERLESELRIAASLQQSLLPKRPPAVPGLELLGWSRPAREVGGDFYDYIELGPDCLAVVIGDATDKGLSAALHITECWSVMTALAQDCASPAELLHRTNAVMFRRYGETGRFVTIFLMYIDLREGHLRYAVAGHNPPILSGGDPKRRQDLTSRIGYPLGVFSDAEFEDIEVPLVKGDTVLLYSDGVTEAHGPSGYNLYGDQRLRDLAAEHCGRPVAELLDVVRTDIERFMDGATQHDDMTLVGLRYCPA